MSHICHKHTATHCNTLQHTATHCTVTQGHGMQVLQVNVTNIFRLQHASPSKTKEVHPTATHSNTRCNTHCNSLQHTATHYHTQCNITNVFRLERGPNSKTKETTEMKESMQVLSLCVIASHCVCHYTSLCVIASHCVWSHCV